MEDLPLLLTELSRPILRPEVPENGRDLELVATPAADWCAAPCGTGIKTWFEI